jgi:Phosphoenolpyruvate carboxykinase
MRQRIFFQQRPKRNSKLKSLKKPGEKTGKKNLNNSSAGPRVVKGDGGPSGGGGGAFVCPMSPTRVGFLRAMSDAGLKPTVVYHNLTPAELYEKALKHEPGTHVMASGALAALSGAKTGRSPKDKRVVREPSSENDVWWATEGGKNGSPNFEMDEHTFLLNRERAVDYLNMLERIYVFDGYAGWDEGTDEEKEREKRERRERKKREKRGKEKISSLFSPPNSRSLFSLQAAASRSASCAPGPTTPSSCTTC